MAEQSTNTGKTQASRLLATGAVFLGLVSAPGAEATFRYGPIQISGNAETQQLFRFDQGNGREFEAFDLIQQRNTVRLQYEHDIVEGGRLLDMVDIPFIRKANLFLYHRFVYESVFDIAPGASLRTNDRSRAGSLDETHLSNGTVHRDFPNRARKALAIENVLREAFVDFELNDLPLPVSFRVGRQQIVWGNTVNFRALDSVNPLDLSWHFQQEAGVLGRVGFSELRIPSWTAKMLVQLPTFWHFSNNFLEVYDTPFDFQPTKVSFNPRPWGLPFRDPFRGGLVVDAGATAGLPPNQFFVQPCFDFTGNRRFNMESDVDFSSTAETGLCPTQGLPRTRFNQGLYDRRDPGDVNQFGARFGSTFTPIGLGFTINYMYRRHFADGTGGGVIKNFGNFALAQAQGNPTSFIEFTGVPGVPGDGTETCDPATGQCMMVDGFFRIPVEIYYPYVSVFGASFDYFDELTAAVYNFEIAASKGVPIAQATTVDALGVPAVDSNGLRRTWDIELALLVDRPTWITFLNRGTTFTILAQYNASLLPKHEELRCSEPGMCTQGDVGVVSTEQIPGLFRDSNGLDERKQLEQLTILALQTFYWGGSLAPLIAWVNDWTNAPAMEWLLQLQYLPHPSLILEPTVRIFWTNGRTVDDRFGVSQFAGRSELQLKAIYQF